MNRAPRELIEDLQAALIAERQARQALREATHHGVEVMRKLRTAGVPWTLIARHAAQILGGSVSEVGRLAATLRQRAWSVSRVSRDHEIRAGASGAGAAISSSSSGRQERGGKDNDMPTEKKIIKRTTVTEEFEPEQPEGEDFDDLDEGQDEPDDEEEGRGKPRGKRSSHRAA